MTIIKWFFRILPVFLMGAIWIMSGLPADAIVELPSTSIDRFIKESLHLIEFAIVYLSLVGAWLTTDRITVRVSLICALLAAAYGLLDEFHQSFMPYRSATFIDLVKDWIGVSVSWYVIREAYFREKRFVWLGKLLKGFQNLFTKTR